MRNVFVLCAILLVFTLSSGVCQAQGSGNNDSRLSLGVLVGGNAAGGTGLERLYDTAQWRTIVPTADRKYRFGLAAGAFVNYKITDKVSIQPEVFYSQAGCKRDFNLEINQVLGATEVEWRGGFKATVELDYIEIPLMAKFVFNNHPTVQAFITVGPSVGINVGAKMPYDVQYTYREFVRNGPQLFASDTSWTREYDIKDLVKPTNFSVMAGAGLDFHVGPGTLNAVIRYIHGFTNVIETTGRIELAPNEFLYFDEAKGRSMSIMVGYRFRLM